MTSARVARLRELLRESGFDGAFLSHPTSIRYVSGFTGSNALCIVTRRSALFCTDPRYREQARAEVRGWKRVVGQGSLFDLAASSGVLRGVRRAAFESGHVTYAAYRQMRVRFRTIRLHPTADLVEQLVLTKTPAEIALIRRAVTCTEQTLGDVLKEMRPGVTERDIAAEISYRHRRYGADGDAFEPLVGSGERSALPHARPTDRKLRRGDCVTLDLGCAVEGYRSDLTRTVSIGRPTARLRRIHAVALAAQQEALEAMGPDVPCADVDGVARRRVAAEGFAKSFPHSLGHGLGLSLHERPRLAPRSADRLRTGNVVTVEPGIYLPGEYGVRIEDDIVVTAGGVRALSTFPRALLVI